MHEFDIIRRFFHRPINNTKEVILGPGDDAAIMQIPTGFQLITSIDTLVSNVHFFESAPAKSIGYKSLAVSLSDMAAMGAQPQSILASLTLPHTDEKWLKDFAQGFFELADIFKIDLIGGDMSSGPLSISTVVNGLAPTGKALQLNNAKPGDLIYVSGTLGDAMHGLSQFKQGNIAIDDVLLNRMHYPTPRIELGLALRDIANSATDISDGLVADLTKILSASQVSANIYTRQLPLSEHLKSQPDQKAILTLALSAGDDYELCFTVPKIKQKDLESIANNINCDITCIGEIIELNSKDKKGNLNIIDKHGREFNLSQSGFEHFTPSAAKK